MICHGVLFLIPVVIGKITVKVDAYQEDVGINRVCFYVGVNLKHTDYDAPYEWIWDERGFFGYEISADAVSNDEKRSTTSINVIKFF